MLLTFLPRVLDAVGTGRGGGLVRWLGCIDGQCAEPVARLPRLRWTQTDASGATALAGGIGSSNWYFDTPQRMGWTFPDTLAITQSVLSTDTALGDVLEYYEGTIIPDGYESLELGLRAKGAFGGDEKGVRMAVNGEPINENGTTIGRGENGTLTLTPVTGAGPPPSGVYTNSLDLVLTCP